MDVNIYTYILSLVYRIVKCFYLYLDKYGNFFFMLLLKLPQLLETILAALQNRLRGSC